MRRVLNDSLAPAADFISVLENLDAVLNTEYAVLAVKSAAAQPQPIMRTELGRSFSGL